MYEFYDWALAVLNDLYASYATLPPILQKVIEVLLAIVGGWGGLWLIASRLLKGWSFLALYHHDGRWFSYLRTLPRFLLAARYDLRGIRSVDAARLLTEFEILKPPTDRPRRYDFSSREAYKEALETWKEEKSEWRNQRNEKIRQLIKNKTTTREEIPALTQSQRLERLPVITVDNPARIDADQKAQILRYFEIGKQYDIYQFISYAMLEHGYFAPQFLVHGLMSRFKNDWKPIIDNYRLHFKTPTYISEGLRELQSFEFNCWLLWGPSIPLCTCDQWQTEFERTGKGNEAPILYQYGYGDENNSLDVRVAQGRSADFGRQVASRLIRLKPATATTPSRCDVVGAAPASVLGRIRCGQSLSVQHVCPAQRIVRDPDDGRVYLDFEEFVEEGSAPPSHYYSAYIWIMFVIENAAAKEPEPFHSDRKWRNLLPFFEHGNIADATTMLTLKRNLAAKVCTSLEEILSRKEDRDRSVAVRYACAWDDSNCGHGHVMFSRDALRDATGSKRDDLNKETVPTILDLLEGFVKGDGFLTEQAEQRRLIIERTGSQYASCCLPDIVRELYSSVDVR